MDACKTCKYWREMPPVDGRGEWLGACSQLKLKYWGGALGTYYSPVPQVGSQGIRVDNLSTVTPDPININTGPDFGCVLHEPR